jgi:putative transposase
MILQIQRGLREDGFTVPMTKLCRWFDVSRRTGYYKPVKAKPKVQDQFFTPIKREAVERPRRRRRSSKSVVRALR